MLKQNITDIKGKTKKIACLGCAIRKGEVTPPYGCIAASKYFNAHLDYETPIPGFIIIDSKRHIHSFDELTKAEQNDFIQFLCYLRSGLRKALNIKMVYVIQKETSLHHFHVWIFPRHTWMNKKFSQKIQSVSPIIEYARKNLRTASNLRKIEIAVKKLKHFFSHTSKWKSRKKEE